MGFLKRLFKPRKKKEAKIYVPEFDSAPYAAYSYSRKSAEQLRVKSPPRNLEDDVLQITRERSRSISREREREFGERSKSPTTKSTMTESGFVTATGTMSSLAPSSLLDVNPEFRRSVSSGTVESEFHYLVYEMKLSAGPSLIQVEQHSVL